MTEVTEGKRGNSYTALRKLELGDSFIEWKNSGFTLPGHVDENLSTSQSAEKLADYFSHISQEFKPISPVEFPPRIKAILAAGKTDSSKPVLDEWQVHEKLKKSKKPNSVIPGDLPVKLVKEFTPELSKPIAHIYNRIDSCLALLLRGLSLGYCSL